MTEYIALFALLLLGSILYDKYHQSKRRVVANADSGNDMYASLRAYFLDAYNNSQQALQTAQKPILWIYVPYEYNARDWQSFGSRSSYHLNQPYLFLTVKSIIHRCETSFKIVIIDEASFGKLLPDWSLDLSQAANPVKRNLVTLGLAQLIYMYGGMHVPISFLCFRDLMPMYDSHTRNNTMFVTEAYDDTNIHSGTRLYFPSCQLMGAPKENATMKEFIAFVQRTTSRDFTEQSVFLGDFDTWCAERLAGRRMRRVRATEVGMRSTTDEPITAEKLLGESYIAFFPDMYGIWIPADDILKRRALQWFAYLSPEEIFASSFILAKYMVLALTPLTAGPVIEDMQTAVPPPQQHQWIGFWRTPLTAGTLNVFGFMPQNLGNRVPRATNAGNLV